MQRTGGGISLKEISIGAVALDPSKNSLLASLLWYDKGISYEKLAKVSSWMK